MAPKVGLEPTTNRLTAGCSTTELLRNVVHCRSHHVVDFYYYRQASHKRQHFLSFFCVFIIESSETLGIYRFPSISKIQLAQKTAQVDAFSYEMP